MAFRADASAINGLGHVKRCLSLARTLREMGFATCMAVATWASMCAAWSSVQGSSTSHWAQVAPRIRR